MSDRDETRRAIMAACALRGVGGRNHRHRPAGVRAQGRSRWMDDEISFADVTVVTARLQETVRAFGRVPRGHQTGERAEQPASQCAGARSADHSAPRGTYVRHHSSSPIRCGAWMLRSTSPWTCIPRQIAEKVRKTRYNMVGISASGRRSLATARELVKTIKASVTRVTPIVLGGSVVGGGS
jgi:hypothetical protein